jgi:hypothetical protein
MNILVGQNGPSIDKNDSQMITIGQSEGKSEKE